MIALLVALLVGVAPQVPASVAVTDDALAVMGNPAGLGAAKGADFYYLYNFRPTGILDNSGLCGSIGQAGAFWEPGAKYGFASGFGSRGYYGGVKVVRDSMTRWGAGALVRPVRWLSLGAVWNDFTRDWGSVAAGVAVRPFGPRLTLSADALVERPQSPVVGLDAEPLDGLAFAARLKPDDMSFSFGLTLGLGKAAIGGVGSRVADGRQAGGFVRLSSRSRRSLVVNRRRYVELKLAGSISDQKPGFSLSGARSGRTTYELLNFVRQAAEDRSVAGILLRIESFSMGFGQAEEFRAELERFRGRDKKVIVYADGLGMNGFYIASAADSILLYPMGEVSIPGITFGALFLKGTLEKLGLEFSGVRYGKYKSAIETFTEDSLSGPNREQLEALLDAFYAEFITRASEGRALVPESLERLVDEGLFTSAEAKSAGLIDAVCYPDELDEVLKKAMRGRKVADGKYRPRVDYEYEWQHRPRVAVVYAGGGIADGESSTDFLTGSTTMGAATIVRALRAARTDPSVKAVVLRIDSPGGDGFASDRIWREAELLRKKKPLVVSMGNVAASGGYYIACNAERVFADATTLTGSIGVFSFKLVTEGLYNKLGARRQVLKRGERADAMSDFRAFTPEEESLMLRQVDHFYRQFVQKVADGRKMEFDAVDSVGQGRVWAGSDAARNGLVDEVGGLFAAVEWAKKQAKLGDCEYVFYPKPKSGLGAMLSEFVSLRLPEVRLWP